MRASTPVVRRRRSSRASGTLGTSGTTGTTGTVVTLALTLLGVLAGLGTAPAADAVSGGRSGPVSGPGAHVGMSPNTGVAPAIVGSNEQAGFAYFQSKNLTATQAAAIVGNLDQESGMDPTAVQRGGPGRGIAQWSVGGRWDTDPGDNVAAFARQQGQSATSLGLQLDFIWFELSTYPYTGLAQLKAATTITDAVTAFQDRYEGCGDCRTDKRVEFAQSAYDRYANPSGPVGTAGSTSVTNGSTYHVFWVRGADGHVLHSYFATKWATEDLGGSMRAAPGATFHDNRYDLFAVGPDGRLFQKYRITGWTGWQPIATGWAPGVSAVWNGTRYDVFGHSTAGHLLQAYYAGGAWHVSDLGGVTRGTPGVTFHDNRYDVFAVSPNASLYQVTHTTAGWGSWHPVSAGSYLASDNGGAVARWTGSQYHVFTTGRDGTLKRIIFTTSWSTPSSLGGSLAQAPGLTYARGRFDVFAPFTTGHLDQTTYYPTTGQTPWHAIA